MSSNGLMWYAFHADAEDLEELRASCPEGVAERTWARYVFSLGIRLLRVRGSFETARQALQGMPALPAAPGPRHGRRVRLRSLGS